MNTTDIDNARTYFSGTIQKYGDLAVLQALAEEFNIVAGKYEENEQAFEQKTAETVAAFLEGALNFAEQRR